MQPQFEKFNERGHSNKKENRSQEKIGWDRTREEYNRICIECEQAVEAEKNPEEKERIREGYKELIDKAMKAEWAAHQNWVKSVNKEAAQLNLKDFMQRNQDN